MSDSGFTDPLSGTPMAAPEPPPAPDWLKDLPDDLNPYALRLRREPALGEVSLGQRAKANVEDSYYRGTLAGSEELLELQRIAVMSPEVFADYSASRRQLAQGQVGALGPMAAPTDYAEAAAPATPTPEEARAALDRIRAGQARYETMPGFDGVLEGGAALAGQLGGGMASPESWITRLPGVRWAIGKVVGEAAETVAGRILDAALSQGAINTLTDPGAQAGAVATGLQPGGYDPLRTALAFPVGAAVGGALHGAGEAVGAVARRRAGRAATDAEAEAAPAVETPERAAAEIAAEDPAMRPEPPAEAPAVPADAGEAVPSIGVVPTAETAAPAAAHAPIAAVAAESEPPRVAPQLIGAPVDALPPHRVSAGGDGAVVDVVPVVVEARDLKTSADEGYEAALQPRQRDRAAAEQQVREMASRLDPERLGFAPEADRGAPIVGGDGLVESGNGRVMAIRQAYAEGGDAARGYRDWLEAHGVDVGRYAEPVLVRQRITEFTPEQRQDFAVAANRPATLALSAPERALADARSITPDMLDLIRADDLAAVANRDFVRAFVERLPQTEQGVIATAEGGLSAEGLMRVRNAVLASAYGETPDTAALLSRIAEATHDNVKSISNALVAAAPLWARLRADIEAGRVRPEVDVTAELLEAVRRTADLRARNIRLTDFLAQQDAFDRLARPVEDFMRVFYDPAGRRAAGQARIAEGLKAYASEASKVTAEPGLDLGLAPVTAAELQRIATERARGGPAGEQTGVLFRGSAGDGQGAAGGRNEIRRPGAGGDRQGAGGAGTDGARPREGDTRPAELAADDAGGLSFGARPQPELPPAGAGEAAVHSLQQQAFDLAEALDLPLREGRVRSPKASGQYDTRQDVARVRAVADFETVAHEAGHAVEKKIGPELTALTRRYAAELKPLDYDPAKGRVNEGFAEWMRLYLTAPARAERAAPGFSAAFRELMQSRAPDLLASLEQGRAAYAAWVDARSDVRLEAIVQRAPTEGAIETLRQEGMARTIGLAMSRVYRGIFDSASPMTRYVRDVARAWRDASGVRPDLQGADNPENLFRLFGRSHQAAIGDLKYGVMGYRSIERDGPALADALALATGKPGLMGRWDDAAVKEFSNYLVARRGEVLWSKYDAGLLPNRPLAMSRADVADAIARYEAAHPSFRDASGLAHDYMRALLKKQFEAGLIERELYDTLRREPFYVPLLRDMRDRPMAGEGGAPGAGRQDGPGMVQLIRRQRGSDRDILDPIQAMMTQTLLVERTVAHNEIIRSMVNLARQATKAGATGVGRLLEEIPPSQAVGKRFELAETIEAAARQHGIDPTDTKVLLGAVTDMFGEDPILGTIFRAEPAGKRGEPVTFWREGGQLRAVRLISGGEGLPLYELLSALPPAPRDWAIQFGALSATALRVGVTTNPVFAITNWLRDQLAAAVLHPGYMPFNPRGIVREIGQDRFAQLYAQAGGVSPGAGGAGLSEMLINRGIDEMARRGWAVQKVGALGDLVTKGELRAGLKALGELVETAEAGTRHNIFARVFSQKKRQGLSDYDAMIEGAAQATDLMDFGRNGDRMQTTRSLVPFITAHLQGLDKFRRTLFTPLLRAARGDLVTEGEVAEVTRSAQAWGLLGVSGMLGFAWALNHAHRDEYRDANEDVRASHLIIPGTAYGRPGGMFIWPKPFELAVGFNLGEMLGLAVATNDPRTAEFAFAGLREVFMPPNVLNSIPAVKTFAELALGRSFFTGRDLVPGRLQRLRPEEQFTENTSALAKAIGGAIGVSPIKVDYAVGQSFGLWGRDLMALSNAADPDAAAPALEDTMFFRRLFKRADQASETTKQFWKLAAQQNGQYAQAKSTYEAMLAQFRDGDVMSFLAGLPAPERAYVTLQSAADENGKPRFTAEEKRLHPLTRAATAVLTIQGYTRELSRNTQRMIGSGERFVIDPRQRRQAIENLRILAAIEQRNALVIAGERGYAGRPLLSAEDQFQVLRAVAPPVADELATRYATARIAPTATIARLWPEAQKRLLAEGGQAELRELAFDARIDGYAFEGERVRRAPVRRVEIPGQPAAARPAPSPAAAGSRGAGVP